MVRKLCKKCKTPKKAEYCNICKQKTRSEYISIPTDEENAREILENFKRYLRELVEA